MPADQAHELPPTLLAVDLGLRTGLALYGGQGRLLWYRSQHIGSAQQLRRLVPRVLAESGPGLRLLLLEGPRQIAEHWLRPAERRDLPVRLIGAETWRTALLYQREQRSGEQAKRRAVVLARRVIDWSGARRPTSLRHDAAEAILLGLWGVLELGWLPAVPEALRAAGG